MLVILEKSLAKIPPTDQSSISGLESVLTSSYNGEHFLISSFPVIQSLLKLPLSLKGKAVLQRIRNTTALHGHLPYPESFILEIVFQHQAERKSDRRWTIPVTDFKNKNFPPSVVLGENMLDAKAYSSAAKQARIKHGHTESCKPTPDAGGGSQTAVKLEGYLNLENGYCFCITDGDYKEPTGTQSAVTSACKKLVADNSWPAFSTDFHARSIENIIPFSLIEESYGPSPLPNNFHSFKKIYEEDCDTAKYIDAKSGLKYCGLTKLKVGSERYKFWLSKIEKHKLEQKFNEYIKNPPKCTNDKCESCSIIDGLGGGTLKQVVNYFDQTTDHKLAQHVPKTSIWCDIGLLIYHWTIADKPSFS